MPSYTLPYTGVLDVPANTMLGNNTGSAAAAIGLTQAQTLTFLGDPGGAFGADAATQITPSTAIVLDEATGNEIGLDLSYTVNKATSGTDTGLLLNKTDTASPGTSLLMDLQVGGSSVASVDDTGTFAGQLTATAPAATDVPLSITGAAAQSANLFDIGANGGAAGDLFSVDAAGVVTVKGDIETAAGVALHIDGNTGGTWLDYNNSSRMLMGIGGVGIWANMYPVVDNSWDLGKTDRHFRDGYFTGEIIAGQFTATAPAATDVPVTITGAAAQSANLFNITSNGGTAGDLLSVDSAGDATFGGDLALSSPTVPASAAATGVAGTVSWAAGYIYICTATDTWKRVAIATW